LDDQKDDENEGIPHCGQIQEQLVFLTLHTYYEINHYNHCGYPCITTITANCWICFLDC